MGQRQAGSQNDPFGGADGGSGNPLNDLLNSMLGGGARAAVQGSRLRDRYSTCWVACSEQGVADQSAALDRLGIFRGWRFSAQSHERSPKRPERPSFVALCGTTEQSSAADQASTCSCSGVSRTGHSRQQSLGRTRDPVLACSWLSSPSDLRSRLAPVANAMASR